MKKTDAENNLNYEVIKIKDGVDNAPTPKLQKDGKTVLVSLASALDGDYQVTVKPIAAAEGTEKTALYTTKITFAADQVRPVLTEVLYPRAGVAELVFSEYLSTKGTITTDPVEVPAITNSLEHNKITLEGLKNGKEYTVTILAAKDMAGNLVSPNPLVVKVQNNLSDAEVPVAESVKTIGLKTVVIKFSEAVKGPNYASVKVDNAAKPADTQVFDAEKLELTYTVDAGLGTAGPHTLEVSAFQDLVGNAGVAKKFNVQLADKVMIEKLEVSDDNKQVTITFTEAPVDGGGDLDLTLLDSEGITTTVTVADAELNVAGKTLVLTRPAGAEFKAGSYSGKLTSALVTNLKEDTPIAFEVTPVEDTEQPKPTVGAINAQTATVTYDKEMGPSAKDVANYTVEGNAVFETAIFDGNSKTVKLTFKKASISIDGDYTFEISSKVTGKNGKAIKAFSEAKTFKENIAPVVEAVTLDVAAKTITVDFSEEVKYAGHDYAEVYIDGAKVELDDVTPATDLTAGAKKAEIKVKNAIDDITKPIKVKFVKDLKDQNGNLFDKTPEHVVTP